MINFARSLVGEMNVPFDRDQASSEVSTKFDLTLIVKLYTIFQIMLEMFVPKKLNFFFKIMQKI